MMAGSFPEPTARAGSIGCNWPISSPRRGGYGRWYGNRWPALLLLCVTPNGSGACSAGRRSRSEEFFASAAGQWDGLRAELFGGRTELLPLLALLEPTWTVGDLGCGTGHLTQALAPFVARVIAVDGSAAMLRSARSRLGDLPNVDIRRGDLEQLPVEGSELDAAFLLLVLPYAAEPDRVIAEAVRALKPGGKLVVTDLMPHERAEYRQTMGHQWQGFAEAPVLGWMTDAGLVGARYSSAPLDPAAKGPMLFVAVGVKQ